MGLEEGDVGNCCSVTVKFHLSKMNTLDRDLLYSIVPVVNNIVLYTLNLDLRLSVLTRKHIHTHAHMHTRTHTQEHEIFGAVKYV